jgi:hypothetical protein
VSRYVPVALQREVRERFGNRCAYCRTAEALTVVTFELEHVTPKAAGGETSFDNLVLACPSCNRYKATRQHALDPDTGEWVRLFHPHQDRWAAHFAWDEDGVTLLGETPIGRATVDALRMNRPQLLRVRRLWVKLGEHPPHPDDQEVERKD